MHALVHRTFRAHERVFEAFERECAAVIVAMGELLVERFRAGGRLLICGCGGSAADAQHVAAEMVNRFRFDRPPLPAFALTTDASVLTSIANDASFDRVFERQIEGLGRPGDALLALSTSGRSPVVLRALEAARRCGISTLGLTGSLPSDMLPLCDLLVAVPTSETARIQECHEFAYHTICALVEEALFANGDGP